MLASRQQLIHSSIKKQRQDTWEKAAWGSEVQGQPQVYSNLMANLGSMRLCFKTSNKRRESLSLFCVSELQDIFRRQQKKHHQSLKHTGFDCELSVYPLLTRQPWEPQRKGWKPMKPVLERVLEAITPKSQSSSTLSGHDQPTLLFYRTVTIQTLFRMFRMVHAMSYMNH